MNAFTITNLVRKCEISNYFTVKKRQKSIWNEMIRLSISKLVAGGVTIWNWCDHY